MDPTPFSSAREFLVALIRHHQGQWGYQALLAKAAGCQRSYFSAILKGKASLSPDQASGISSFLQHDEEETDYFVTLVLLEKAATELLRKKLRRKLKKMRDSKEDLASRYKVQELENGPAQSIYYSSWLYSGVHILLGIPGYNNPADIAQRLAVQPKVVEQVLHSLESLGLAKHTQEFGWTNARGRIHLPKGSPLTLMNHMNWRNKAAEDVMKTENSFSTHYTAVQSISKSDLPKLKELVLKAIDESRKIVLDSGKEELVCFTCDLFVV